MGATVIQDEEYSIDTNMNMNINMNSIYDMVSTIILPQPVTIITITLTTTITTTVDGFDSYIEEGMENWVGKQQCIIKPNSSNDVMSTNISPRHWLNPDIADQVSIDERKTNSLSSPSESTISALTNDSVSTPIAKGH